MDPLDDAIAEEVEEEERVAMQWLREVSRGGLLVAAARTDILSEVELEGAVVASVVVEAPLTADAPLL